MCLAICYIVTFDCLCHILCIRCPLHLHGESFRIQRDLVLNVPEPRSLFFNKINKFKFKCTLLVNELSRYKTCICTPCHLYLEFETKRLSAGSEQLFSGIYRPTIETCVCVLFTSEHHLYKFLMNIIHFLLM